MNTKKYVIGSIVVFIVLFVLDYIFHEMIMASQYDTIIHIFRAEEAMLTYMPAMILGELIIAFGFCYIFIKGYENKGIGEGVRYGFYIGLFFGVGPSLISYTVYPLTGWIMLGYLFWYPIECMILGAVFASLYKPK